MDPKNVVAIIMRGTTIFLSHPERQTPIKHIAGIIEAALNLKIKYVIGLCFCYSFVVFKLLKGLNIFINSINYLSIVIVFFHLSLISHASQFLYPNLSYIKLKTTNCIEREVQKERHSENLKRHTIFLVLNVEMSNIDVRTY